jgi:alpha-L-fucosidase 2
MDIAIIKEVLGHLLEICDGDGAHQQRCEAWKEILAHLPDYELNEDGGIREWLDPDFSDNDHHRHQSHIYPVFPGNEIDAISEPELYQAFKIAVDKRLVIGLGEQTGWSLSHMANINARLGDGNTALECLDIMARSCIGKNFFTYHNDYRYMGITDSSNTFGQSTPFQIDANMGWTSSIYEMLLYSTTQHIKIFPALPKRFNKGSISNLRARGQINVSLEWDQEENLYRAEITADVSTQTQFMAPDQTVNLDLKAKQNLVLEGKLIP